VTPIVEAVIKSLKQLSMASALDGTQADAAGGWEGEKQALNSILRHGLSSPSELFLRDEHALASVRVAGCTSSCVG
jgi:hypothetical protein